MAISRKMALVLTACFSALSVVLIAEAYIRFISPHGFFTPETLRRNALCYIPSAYSKGIFSLEEQRIHRSDNVRIFINALGYRGHDIPVAKPKGAKRIMFYGGSSVFDYMATEGEDWPHLVEKRLRDSFPGVEVVNAGIPAHTSFDCLTRFLAEGQALGPDIVVLYCGWNDMKYLRGDEPLLRQAKPAERFSDPLLEYQSRWDRLLCRLSQLYVRLRYRYYCHKLDREATGIKYSGAWSDQPSEHALRQFKLTVETFVDAARNAGAVPVLMTEARLVSRTNTEAQKKRIRYDQTMLTHDGLCKAYERVDQILREISDGKKALLIDSAGALNGNDAYLLDHVHTSAAGSQRLAEIAAGALKDQLSKM